MKKFHLPFALLAFQMISLGIIFSCADDQMRNLDGTYDEVKGECSDALPGLEKAAVKPFAQGGLRLEIKDGQFRSVSVFGGCPIFIDYKIKSISEKQIIVFNGSVVSNGSGDVCDTITLGVASSLNKGESASTYTFNSPIFTLQKSDNTCVTFRKRIAS